MTTLGLHFGLGKKRLATLAALIGGIVQCRTVNLWHLAVHLCSAACHASKYRRLQRFFQFVRLDQDVAARLVVYMLDLERPKFLALDRTNWKLGSRDINILMLAIVTRRLRVPLLFRARCTQIESFCFSFGEPIHEEGGAGRCGSSAKRPDEVGGRPNGNPKGRAGLGQILRASACPGHQPDLRRTPRPPGPAFGRPEGRPSPKPARQNGSI